MDPKDRFKNYDKEYCWQYDLKLKTLEEDLVNYNLTMEEVKELKSTDFEFEFVHSNKSKEELHSGKSALHVNDSKKYFNITEEMVTIADKNILPKTSLILTKEEYDFNSIEIGLLIATGVIKETNINRIKSIDIPYNPVLVREIKSFIERYEWLGKMSAYPTHFFTARYKGHLACVVVMDMPNAFSKLLGENTRKMERLISRGASVSWAPKNLASSLIMWSIKWMVQNTRYRLFTAYSDPEARELGTIYQACNFMYLGQSSGSNSQYLYSGRWVSDRTLRSRSAYKRYAKELCIPWDSTWSQNDRILWDNMPDEVEKQLRDAAKRAIAVCEKRDNKPKHKYAYILGRTTKETQELKNMVSKEFRNIPYPKNRGI